MAETERYGRAGTRIIAVYHRRLAELEGKPDLVRLWDLYLGLGYDDDPDDVRAENERTAAALERLAHWKAPDGTDAAPGAS